MTDPRTFVDVAAMRASDVADLVRQERLIVILRRVTPRARMLDLVTELAAAGARLFEITLDSPAAAEDLEACRVALPARGPGRCLVGAGQRGAQRTWPALRGSPQGLLQQQPQRDDPP